MKSNDELRSDVELELNWNPEVDGRHITVTAAEGAVALSGYVPSYFQKTRAVAGAERVYGVKVVADELDVRLHEAHIREDSDIAKAVAHIFEWNLLLSGQRVQAKVSNGYVTLTGEVDWNYEREEAEYVVDRVLGIKSVVNEITVKHHAAAAQVERKITDSLARQAGLDARQIHVTTSGNTAVLSGTVRSLAEDRIVTNAAWQAEGVGQVEDNLVVQP